MMATLVDIDANAGHLAGFKTENVSAKEYQKIYPDLSVLLASLSTSTLKHARKHVPDFDVVDFRAPPLEPSAPPADIVSNISVPCCPPQPEPSLPRGRSKSDLHRWSQWRSRINQEMADFLKGSRRDVGITQSFEDTFPGKQMHAIYNHALTKDCPSTCLASVPYLLYGIPRVKRASPQRHGHSSARHL